MAHSSDWKAMSIGQGMLGGQLSDCCRMAPATVIPSAGCVRYQNSIDPLLGFHLATAYAPLEPQSPLYLKEKGSDQLQKVVDTARLEFIQWAASFRNHVGDITIRFFAGDAIAFAHALQHARVSGSLTAGFYRDRYQLEPLTLMEIEYNATGTAPLRFDVVDASNLCDHVGPLNLLTAVSPLLSNRLSSTLYTEVIPKATKSRKEVLDAMLCGDSPIRLARADGSADSC